MVVSLGPYLSIPAAFPLALACAYWLLAADFSFIELVNVMPLTFLWGKNPIRTRDLNQSLKYAEPRVGHSRHSSPRRKES